MHRTVRGRITLLLIWSMVLTQMGVPRLLAQQPNQTRSIPVPDVQGLSAKEADGIVDRVQENELTIKPEFHFLPSVGDKIRIFMKVPGVGEASVGTAIVTRIDDERVFARVEKATGKVQPGHIIRSLRAEPAIPPSEREQRFLVVKSPTARVMEGTNLVAEIPNGQRLPFTRQNGDWYLVEIQQAGESRRGWIHRRDVFVEKDSAPAAAAGREKVVPGWGLVVDPKGDCTVAIAGETLSIAVPGTYHDLSPFKNFENMDAPRVLQEVRGDFALQVRVKRFVLPSPGTGVNLKKPYSYVSAGLLVWQDPLHFVRFQRAANADTGFVGTFGQYISEDGMIGGSRIELADEDTFLRVERRAGKFMLAQSTDGRTWTTVRTQGKDLTLLDRVKVGVFVVNATNRPIRHEFTDLELATYR